jgi:polyhydroxyalkanoate synthesis repressor PhaR
MKKNHVEDGGPVLIKKYENRRLYSSTAGRHLTLTEVAEMVRKGQSIKVVDAASGVDITAELLTQILLEQGRARGLPVDFLTQMIRLQEDMLGSFVDRVIGGGLGLFWQAQKAATEAGLKEMAKLYDGIAKSGRDMAAPFLGAFPWMAMANAPSGREHELEEELRALKARIAELEAEKSKRSSRERNDNKSAPSSVFAETKRTKGEKKKPS